MILKFLDDNIDYKNYNLNEYLYKSELHQEIGRCDKILSDLDHKLELCSLSAIELTQTIIKRRQTLQERRMLKNELFIVNEILLYLPQKTKKAYDDKHAVRMLKKLFEKAKKKSTTKFILRAF